MENTSVYTEKAVELLMQYGPKLLLAIITLIAGWWIIKQLLKGFNRMMDKRKLDESLKPFLRSLIGALLKIVLFIMVASMIGIETTSLVAVLGAAGLAVGLALQGSLANFAGGVLILLLKPFKVGDFITAQGFSGTVREIQIFYTVLMTPQNEKIIIPNGTLSNNSITNITAEETRRLDLTFGIGYSDDIDKAKGILKQLVDGDSRSLQEPAPQVMVQALADSSVNFTVRVWVKNDDYWPLFFDMQESVKKTFDKEGVSIPFPQRDVHLFQEK